MKVELGKEIHLGGSTTRKQWNDRGTLGRKGILHERAPATFAKNSASSVAPLHLEFVRVPPASSLELNNFCKRERLSTRSFTFDQHTHICTDTFFSIFSSSHFPSLFHFSPVYNRYFVRSHWRHQKSGKKNTNNLVVSLAGNNCSLKNSFPRGRSIDQLHKFHALRFDYVTWRIIDRDECGNSTRDGMVTVIRIEKTYSYCFRKFFFFFFSVGGNTNGCGVSHYSPCNNTDALCAGRFEHRK